MSTASPTQTIFARSGQEILNQAEDVKNEVMKQGADACDIVISEGSEFSVQVRKGKIERLEESVSRGLGIRVFKKGKVAITGTTDFSEGSIKTLVKDLMQIADLADSDPANGLAPKNLLGIYSGKLNSFDPAFASLSASEKIAIARACEEAGFAADKRIVNSEGASWSDGQSRYTLLNSDGFSGQQASTSGGISASFVAEADGIKQTDYWYSYHRFRSELDSPESVGEKAAQRTAAKLGGRKVPSQVVSIVLDPLISRRFAGMIFGAATGGSIYRKASFLVGKLGEQIAASSIHLIDDPTLIDGPSSRPFDGEGLPSRRQKIVESGKLLLNPAESYSARKLGIDPTGNASRGYLSSPSASPSNLFIKPGTESPETIVKSVKNGLYVTELMGMGLNSVTGDISQGAAGFWIENGEIAFPVQEITIAGNILEMLNKIEAIGNDLSFKMGATAAPTLLIGSVTVGGS